MGWDHLIVVGMFSRKWDGPRTEELPQKWALWVCENGCNIFCSCVLRPQLSLGVLGWKVFNGCCESFGADLVLKNPEISKSLCHK